MENEPLNYEEFKVALSILQMRLEHPESGRSLGPDEHFVDLIDRYVKQLHGDHVPFLNEPENVAEHCRETGEQWCHVCKDFDCGDNVNPAGRSGDTQSLQNSEAGIDTPAPCQPLDDRIAREDVEIDIGLVPIGMANGLKFSVFEVVMPVGEFHGSPIRKRVWYQAESRYAEQPCNPGEMRLKITFNPDIDDGMPR